LGINLGSNFDICSEYATAKHLVEIFDSIKPGVNKLTDNQTVNGSYTLELLKFFESSPSGSRDVGSAKRLFPKATTFVDYAKLMV
jgi:hypothetical protein